MLAVEDADFYAHDGVNLRATVRALVRNVDEGETVQGGSTITQQVVKEELVGNEQTVDRKAREAVLARRLEEVMTKDEILERYLNTVYLGQRRLRRAGRRGDLLRQGRRPSSTSSQSAFLAGMIANPTRFDPIRGPGGVAGAARRGPPAGWSRRAASPRRRPTTSPPCRRSPPTINQVNPETQDYFVEEVKQALFDDPRLGATREERQNRVFRGGLRIYTTLDPRAQALATTARNDVLAEVAPEGTPDRRSSRLAPDPVTGDARNATGAVVSVEPGTGAVRAMVGGAGFESEKFNVTTQGVGRSGGSTFKIFVLMALLENGYLPDRQRERQRPVHVQGHPRDVPRPVHGRELRRQRRRGRHDHLADAALVELRLRAPRPDRRHRQGGRSEARRMGITTPLDAVVSMPLGTKEVHPIDMAGGGRVDRRRRHVATSRTTSTASRAPTGR